MINLQRVKNLAQHIKSVVAYSIESEIIKKSQGREIKSSNIPNDDHEASIISIGEINHLDLHVDQLTYNSSNVFIFPFSVKVESYLSYFIHKSDYCLLDDERTDRMSVSDLNDHVYSVEEEYLLALEGNMSITLDASVFQYADISDEDLIEAIENSQVDIDSIDKISITH